MHGPLERTEPPDSATVEQRTSNELVRLIRKLRWIGMETEADALAEELEQRRDAGAFSVITPSRDTD